MRTDLTGVDQESDDKQILYEQIVGALKEVCLSLSLFSLMTSRFVTGADTVGMP